MLDKSSDSFIQAIQRMSNRRSMPLVIHSDNAKEFVSGKNKVKELYEHLNSAETHKRLSDEFNIKWFHSVPVSPSKGGVIERLVKIIKVPLYKTICNRRSLLTETEFHTVLTSIEAASNSRPLSSMSEAADDDNILSITPAHLMIGQRLRPLPSDIASYEDPNSKFKLTVKQRLEARKSLANQFWNMWKQEYMLQLRELTKNYLKKRDLQSGDFVLLTAERVTKLHWPIGVIHEVFKGRDGKVRSVLIKLPLSAKHISDDGRPLIQHNYIRRGINQMSLLEEALETTTSEDKEN